MRGVTEQGDPVFSLLAELRTATGSPARVTLDDCRTPDGTVKIPGTIRDVTASGILVELFFPLLTPRIGSPVVLEVMARNALLQCYTVVQRSASPQSLVLDMPDGLHPIQRRRFPRANVSVSTTVAGDSLPVSVPATVVNVSAGGCALALTERLPIGALVKVNLKMIGLQPTEVWAHVVRCSLSTSPNGRWEAGLAFFNLAQSQVEQLVKYVEQYK